MSQKLRNKLQKPRSNKRRGNIFYNYSQRPQTYGIGSAVKLLQKDVVISGNSGINFQYSTKELDMVNMALQYKYVKILEVAVVQDQINLPNEQDKLYGIVDWGTITEGYANLEESDNAKIFKNIGRNQFIFRPPRILTNCYVKTGSTTSETRQVFASGFNEVERLFGASAYGYYFPFYYSFKNNSTVDRKLRIIVKLVFRGSKNTNDSEAAKRINEVVNSERNIDELIAEKLNELKQLKLKKGVQYVEMGTQTDDVQIIKEEDKEEKSVESFHIKSELLKRKEKIAAEAEARRQKLLKDKQRSAELKEELNKKLAKEGIKPNDKSEENQEKFLKYLKDNYEIKYDNVKQIRDHVRNHGCTTVFKDRHSEKIALNYDLNLLIYILDEYVYNIFKPQPKKKKDEYLPIDIDEDWGGYSD